MEANTLVLMCITFCVSFAFASLINRPRVIIQNGQNEGQSGFSMALLGLLVLAGLAAWLFLPEKSLESGKVPLEEIPAAPHLEQVNSFHSDNQLEL